MTQYEHDLALKCYLALISNSKVVGLGDPSLYQFGEQELELLVQESIAVAKAFSNVMKGVPIDD